MAKDGKRHIAILGSTGSIGTQALDCVAQHPDLFEVELLTANNNSKLLIEQAIRFKPNNVVICNERLYEEVAEALKPHYVKVFAGIGSVCDLMGCEELDMVLAAMVGFSGLKPVVAALEAGKAVALANKETLVAAGALIMPLAARNNAPVIPVDSEHSAIFQCLQGENVRPEKIILTGSGGAFLDTPASEMEGIRPSDALKHPKWNMGAKVTIDSSTLMNKGLEFIEARWLFDMAPRDIEVVIHPESVIHSMVRFADGCVMAQLSNPDMRLPIQYALTYPFRQSLECRKLDFFELGALHFRKPDIGRFPCLGIAQAALEKGGNACCAMNAANEEAVAAFLQEKIRFTDIPCIITDTLEKCHFIEKPDFEAIYSTNFEARRIASEIIGTKYSR
ncbi:MAG: 1-deoxy-D-xylulose-5-phosphate reductoisomerase [Bacteroidales bacterium]|nr:1-deoxy-D-xylulose-5-phosphate reductoisomerase [Bacteroidales bacterium]